MKRGNGKAGRLELRIGLALIAVTVGPLAVGAFFDVHSFLWWGVVSAYLGLSWIAPGALLAIAAAGHAKRLGARHADALGVTVGVLITIALLVAYAVILTASGNG